MRERAEKAGKGPWIKDPDDPAIVLRPDKGDDWDGIVIARVQRDDYGLVEEDTTEFIAHARTDVPALVNALEAVLAIHRHVPTGLDDTAMCSEDLEDWPCPTVTAIETALEPR
jgi:hypothetical protein